MTGAVVAIDGPSGSGKSSVSRGVADRLGMDYLDTGAMYRALTWWLLQRDVDVTDAAAVAAVAHVPDLEPGTDPAEPTIAVDGQDVTAEVRTPQVTAAVSAVAAVPEVRRRLADIQRWLIDEARAAGHGIVVEGRDIGTVVAPDADVKVFLDADPAVRAARRTAELDHTDVGATQADLARRDALDSGRAVSPLTRADDAHVVDATHLDLPEVIDEVVGLVLASEADEAVGRPDEGEPEPRAEGALPVLAVVGRPNVGKSTLVNRFLGRREAVVEDKPGVTRDRVAYDTAWAGRPFTVVDTGGWDPGAEGLAARVAQQAELAVGTADAVLFVVDATVGATDTDDAVVKVLRRSGRPVVLAANKVDDQRTEADAAALWNLGLGQPYAVSALHGRGSGDLLDAVVAALPERRSGPPRPAGPRRVALLGRPNVGKSSLLNRLAGGERAVVDAVAGTTVDPVDELVDLGGRIWQLVDTAGIRRRAHEASGTEYYAVLRTQAALDKAEVAVVLVEANEPLTEQDTRIISMVVDSGRALVLAFNKWDLVDEERRHYLQREIERDLVRVPWAPRVNVSARTGRGVDRLLPAIDAALAGWETRIPTGKLNAFLGRLVAATPPPVRGGKQPKILFATQVGSQPPRIVLFTTGFLEAGYRRFLERRLREEFGFVGSPLALDMRIRERRARRGSR